MAETAVALDAYATLDATTWAALALVLTALGGFYTWTAYRRRGLAAGVRGLAWTLVPLALWLTGTLRLVASIVGDVGDWAAHLVFSPVVWTGIMVAGAAVALFLASAIMRNRGLGEREGRRERRRPAGVASRPKSPKSPKTPKTRDDDIEGMDEIEAILKKHGI